MKNLFDRSTHAALPFPLILSAFALVLWLVLRILLWLQIGPTQMTVTQSATAFGLGLWFDFATLAYMLIPILLVAAILPNRWRASRVVKWLSWAMLTLLVAILLFGAVSELVFWDEFTTRFNFIAVDYLIYTNEVIGNIRQSYPVGLIFTGIAAVAGLFVWLISRLVSFSVAPHTWRDRLLMAGAVAVLPVASFTVANVDQMNGAGNEHALELSGNGVFSLGAAMRRNELDYDRFYKTIPQEEADATLARLGLRRPPLTKAVTITAEPPSTDLGPFTRRPKNIILISVESLSADFLDSYGGTKKLTPQLDRLAAEGYKFERVFATGTRTVRGLEALSLGTPPTPGQAIVRRPNNDHLATIGQLLKHQGYLPFFLYGGYGYFDNMNGYYAANDYKVVDRTDFPKESIPFENIWGVADESLFANSLRILDDANAQGTGKGRPFLAQIMTTSNHRPFTYPDGRIDIPSPGGRDGAVKYTDFAIGQFVDQARAKPWFKDTLFVIVADHCASVAGKTKLPVANYRIPLIFYAPDILKPGVYSRTISQIDIAPTLMNLLGAKGEEHFYGETVFSSMNRPARAFISNYQELGYYKNDLLTVLSPKQKVDAFRIDPVTYAATPVAVDPAMVAEAIAYYQTGSRAFKQGALKSPASIGAQ